MKLIDIKKKYYNKTNIVEALRGVTLEFSENGITMILGSSGCGKTTLLNIMSGKDKQFEGKIEDVPNFDYLTQDFNLLEEMSVYENLIIVKEDKETIEQYLEMFHLSEHKNKKIKYLSNGQKKRIQFIRALLHKPGLLLCDEPTAALDHDNTVMLMEELKKLSNDIQIILVTHDIALAEKYADRIIKMNQGYVVSDEKITNHKENETGEIITKKTFKETLKYVILEIKSRWKDALVTVSLSTLSIVMLFSVYTFFHDVMKQYDYNETFKRADNLILSLPKRIVKIDTLWYGLDYQHLFDFYYGINQVYKMRDIEEIIEENPEIIAVESYWSRQYYKTGGNLKAFDTFSYKTENNEILDYRNNPYYPAAYVYSTEFLEKDEYFRQNAALYVGKPYDNSGLQGHTYFNNMLSCYDLVNNATLPILVGEMPQGESEVLISKNLADKILIDEGYASYEELVGNTIYLGLYGRRNYSGEKDNIVEQNENGEYESVKVNIVDLAGVKVTGISTVENDYSLMVFFNNGYTNNITINHFLNDRKQLNFDYVRFLVEPGSDTEVIAKKIDEKFDYDDQDIVKFAGRGLEDVHKYYKNPNNFSIYFITITIVFMSMFVVVYIFKKKRVNKENNILKTYGYSIRLERFIRVGITTLLSFILALIVTYHFCNYINQFAKDYQYEMLMGYSPVRVALMTFVLGCYLLLIEGIILYKRKRRSV